MNRTTIAICLAALLAAAAARPAHAQETNIRTAHFIPSAQSIFRGTFNTWVERINAEGKGLVRIDTVVSEESIPGMQMPTAIRNGVIDMAGVPPSYYYNVIPEGQTTTFSEVDLPEQRRRGVIDLLQPLMAQKLNAHMLGQYGHGVQFHNFLNKEVAKLEDFKPLKMRTTAAYRPFFNKLVASQLQTPRGEVYTALERGVVDGYANPNSEVKPSGWEKVSKYRVDPGFYSAMVSVLVNKAFWDGLRADQRSFLTRMSEEVLEKELNSKMADADIAAGRALVDGGMKVIKLDGATAEQYLKIAYDSQWEEIVKVTPDNAKKLRQMLSK
jgi:TRAP-type C4-dicarboxylate transport system substrate-binding protein